MTRAAPLLLLAGCATLSAARPLEPGETLVGATLGGALLDFGGPLPLPNVVVEGRHGLPHLADRPLDVGYGLNLTALPFGLLQGHVGASWLLLPQEGARPALSVTDRLFFGLNVPGAPNRVDPELEGWAADQLEVIASWRAGHALPYVALSETLDFGDPRLFLTPAAGVQLDPGGSGGFLFQAEARWYAVNLRSPASIPSWIPHSNGALGISVSAGAQFGGAR